MSFQSKPMLMISMDVAWSFKHVKIRPDLVNSHRKLWKDPPFLMGKLTISTVPFSIANCYKLPEGNTKGVDWWIQRRTWFIKREFLPKGWLAGGFPPKTGNTGIQITNGYCYDGMGLWFFKISGAINIKTKTIWWLYTGPQGLDQQPHDEYAGE